MNVKTRAFLVLLSVVMVVSSVLFSGISAQANEKILPPDENMGVESEREEEPTKNEKTEIAENESGSGDSGEELRDSEFKGESDESEGNETDIEEVAEEESETDAEEAAENDTEIEPTELENIKSENYEEVSEEADETELLEDAVTGLDEEEGIEQKKELEGVYQFGDSPSDSGDITTFSFKYSKNTDIAEVENYIYRQLKARIAKVEFENYYEEFSAGDIVSGLLNRHPELYYVRKGFYESVSYKEHKLTLRFTYDNSLDDASFQVATARALASVKPGMSDLEKAIALHEYLVVNCEYDNDNYKNGTIPKMSYTAYGVLVNHIAVCEGYALAYKYLLNQAGIDCYMVTSTFMKHAWNMVKLDGVYYHVDVTWADPVYDLVGRVQHKYMFCSDVAFINPANNGMNRHLVWKVTDGNKTVDCAATDTRYDDAFWTNCYSPLVMENGNCYYISSGQRIKKADLTKPKAEGNDICGDGGLGYTEPGPYSGLFLLDGRLYYNTKTSICSIELSGDGGRIEFDADRSKGDIYGCVLSQGKVFYAQGYLTNSQKVPVWTADFGDFSVLVPVESITISPEKLVLAVGETELLQTSVSPYNAYEPGVAWLTSNEAVASVENGKVTALGVGTCTITAVAGDMEAVCKVTVTEKGKVDRIAGGRYKNITWEIDLDGKLSVEGTGEFSDSTEFDRAPWSDYGRSIISAEIKVTDMKDASYMFNDCTELVSLDVKNFDTSCVTDMKYMFRNCCSLKELDLGRFDTANVTNMEYMFYLCTSLRKLNVSEFHTAHVTNMRYMFYMCSSLESLDLGGFDTRNVKYMNSMFERCENISSLDLSHFNTGNVVYMDSMFSECTNLISLNLEGFDTPHLGGTRFMFYRCERLTSLDLSSFDVSGVVMMDFMFSNCSSLASLKLGDFHTNRATDMDCMFYGCESLTSLDLSGLNTSRVEGMDMGKMFYGCKSLTSLDLSSFDTSKVTYMGYMFCGCESLTSLDLSSFDTGSLTSMGYMFYGCRSLTSLDLSSFDTSKVTYSSYMFIGCDNLKKIYTPHNLKDSVALPKGDTWYQTDGTSITELPKNLNYSILITKNQVPIIEETYISAAKKKTVYACGDILNIDDLIVKYHDRDGTIKRITDYSTNADEIDMSVIGEKELVITYKSMNASIPITVNERVITKEKVIVYADVADYIYSGREVVCCRSVSVMSKDGKRLTDKVKLSYTYDGTQADGSDYGECAEAPVNAGRYSVTIAAEDEEGRYTGSAKYKFEIKKASLKVKAFHIKLGTDEILPQAYKYEVEGLLGNDRLIAEPSLSCNAEVVAPGVYEIIPQGADAGMNYEITYIKGWLYIADDSDVLPEDIPDSGKIPEGLWIAGLKDYTYTGKAIKQDEMRVYNYNELLRPGKDYSLTYKNNVKANNASDRKTAPVVNIKGKGNYTDTYTAVFKILPVNLSDVMAEDITVSYNKKVQKKVPVLTYNGKKLVNNKDFTLSYPATEQELPDAYKAADCYDIVVTAKPGGNFTGTKTVKLNITDKTLLTKVSVKKISPLAYDGTFKEPELVVTRGKIILTKGVDYRVEYKNNVEVGTASAILTGTGAYAGKKEVTFKITGMSIKGAVITGLEDKQYNGGTWEPEITVTLNGKRLLKNTDYQITYAGNNGAGKAAVVIKGINAYTGTIKKNYKITAYDLENIKEQLNQDITCKYLKGGSRPGVALHFAGKILEEGVDYTITYKNNKSVTTAETKKLPSMIIKGKGNFKGSITKNFSIVSRALDDEELMVDMTAADMVFVDKPGRYISKTVLIDADGKQLVQGRDFEKQLIYTRENGTLLGAGDKLSAGTIVIVTAHGKGAYTGKLSTRYRITEKSFNQVKIKIMPQTYTGNEIILDENDINVTIGKKVLIPDVDYVIVPGSYKNNIKKGTATVKISGKGNYGGTKTVTFKIISKKFIFF